jgi:alkyl hydroperoxide reductase subunit AhpC
MARDWSSDVCSSDLWHQAELLLKNVKFPMGADPTGKLSRMFGVYDEPSGMALRGTFIITPDGKLIGSEINYFNVGRDAGELLRKMTANVYLAAHPNEVCPARWQEGDKTLTPSAKLVGKVYEATKER